MPNSFRVTSPGIRQVHKYVKRTEKALTTAIQESCGFHPGLGQTMKASWLVLVVLASLSLLLTVRSEDAPPVSGAPEVVTSHSGHLPIEASRLSKAWWKKFIQESQSQKKTPPPGPGSYGPLGDINH